MNAALTREENRVKKATSPAIRALETAANRADDGYAAARSAVLPFKPSSLADAAAFLDFVASNVILISEAEMADALGAIAATLNGALRS